MDLVPIVTPPAEKLEGNWLIYGAMPRIYVPIAGPNATQGLTLSLSSDGTTITGAAFLSGTCASGEPFGVLFDNAITAVPDAAGHFSTSSTQTYGWGFTLNGTAPNLSGRPWTGTYQLVNTQANNVCSFSGSGSFTATPVSQMTGTFAGTGMVLSFGGSGTGVAPGAALTVNMTTVQGVSYATNDGKTAYDAELLDGTIQVGGIPCFSHGTASSMYWSRITGNEFQANFTMEDGSTLTALGTIDNPQTTHLLLNTVVVDGGDCAGVYEMTVPGATLSR